MSVSYISEPLTKSTLKLFTYQYTGQLCPTTDAIELSYPTGKTDHKTVEVNTIELDGRIRAVVTFRGYENQDEVDTIVKAMSIMLNKKFTEESELLDTLENEWAKE